MDKRKKLETAIIGLILILLFLMVVFMPRFTPPELNDDLLKALLEARTELESPGITIEEAALNLKTADHALQFVQNDVALLDYPNSYGGADGTLRTRTGNACDKALLLEALLKQMGYQTRLVRASLPSAERPKTSPGPKTPAPAVDNVLRIAKGMVPDHLKDVAVTKPDRDKTLAEMKSEISDSIKAIEKVLAEKAGTFKASLPQRKASPGIRINKDWVWVEAKMEKDKEWKTYDPYLPQLQRPKYAKRDFSPARTTVRVVLESVQMDGRAREVLSWFGPASDVIGYDVLVNFIPADGNPASMETRKSPAQVGLWGAMMRIGPTVSRGGAFTTTGALLNYRGEEVHAGSGPAVTLDKDGRPIFKAVPVSSAKITSIDAAAFPRVKVSVALTPKETPSWHYSHFSIEEPAISGDRILPRRIVSAYAAPRPIYLVVDRSGSMNEQKRMELAVKGIRMLVDQLRPDQRVGLAEFGGDYRLLHKAIPLSEGKQHLFKALDGIRASGSTYVPEAIEKALAESKEPSYILFLSDGMDSYRTAAAYPNRLKKMEEAVEKTPHRIITVGIAEADKQLLRRVATLTDSGFYQVDKVEDLPALYKELGGELSGRVVLSYLADDRKDSETDGGKRKLSLKLEGLPTEISAEYSVPPKGLEPVAGLRLRVVFEEGSEWVWSQERTLHQFTESSDPTELIAEHRLTIGVAGVPTRVIESRLIDGLIDLYRIRKTSDQGTEPGAFSQERGMGYASARQLNAMQVTLPTLVQKSESMKLSHFGWTGPAVFIQSCCLSRQGDDIMRRTDLDWLRHSHGPAWGATLQERMYWGVGVAAVEGRLLQGKSVNAQLLAKADQLVASLHNQNILIHPKDSNNLAWQVTPGGEVKALMELPENRTLKGMSVEETAAKYREIRRLLQYYAALGSAGLGATGSPASSLFTALCTYFDEIVKLYCYSAVSLGILNESMETGEDFDAVEAQRRAASLCEMDGPPGTNMARNLAGALGYGFARGTAENIVTAGACWGLGTVGVPGFGGTGSLPDRAGSGAMSGAVSFGDPTPASASDFSRTVTNAIAPSME